MQISSLVRPRLLYSFVCASALCALISSAEAQVAGDQDPDFATGPNSQGSVHAIALQTNGQVVVAGGFTSFRGATRDGVARLNADGTLDSLNPGLAISGYLTQNPTVNAVALQADGKIIAAGTFTVENQPGGGGVVRLNSDGSLDSSFSVGSGVYDAGDHVGSADVVVVLASGQILVGGDFSTFNGVSVQGLVRLNADGSLDQTFNPHGSGIDGNSYGRDVKSIAVMSNGQIVIGGHFSAYNGTSEGCVARLNADGTLDTTFNDGEGADFAVFAVAVQSDGKVLAGGGYNDFDSVDTQHLVRLNTDGSLDTQYDFNPPGLFIEEVDTILIQPDGTTIVGGDFLSNGGLVNSPTTGVVRLFSDASVDTSFDGTNSVGQAIAVALQPDGNLLVADDEQGFNATGPGDVLRVFDILPIPTVTIAAGVSRVNENGSAGAATFVVTASSSPSVKTKIFYTVKGSAGANFDYVALSGSVKLKPGQTSKTIDVYPINEGIGGGRITGVKVTLAAGAGYNIGSANNAKVKIVDND